MQYNIDYVSWDLDITSPYFLLRNYSDSFTIRKKYSPYFTHSMVIGTANIDYMYIGCGVRSNGSQKGMKNSRSEIDSDYHRQV